MVNLSFTSMFQYVFCAKTDKTIYETLAIMIPRKSKLYIIMIWPLISVVIVIFGFIIWFLIAWPTSTKAFYLTFISSLTKAQNLKFLITENYLLIINLRYILRYFAKFLQFYLHITIRFDITLASLFISKGSDKEINTGIANSRKNWT